MFSKCHALLHCRAPLCLDIVSELSSVSTNVHNADYQEALDLTKAATDGPLKNRLLFHLSYRMNDDKKLVQYHQKLSDTKEDELSLAAIHFLRGHYQEATDIYKRLLIEDKSGLALNVYVAMCYYKLDYYDVSLEILQVYLATYPASIVAINLKACNHFRLYNGKAAEAEVKVLSDHNVAYESQDLIKHNLVVFRDGENALQVLPPLVDVVPEARLNLVIYYLKNVSRSIMDNLSPCLKGGILLTSKY